MVTKKSLSALKMAYISLGAVLIALCSWISVPATVPFTLQTFAVLLVCDLLGMTGGYILGFVLSALVMALMQRLLPRRRVFTLLSMALGLLACYAAGSVWFMQVYTQTKGAISLGAVLSICVVPYLIPDAIKIVLACLISERLRAALHL